MYYDNEMSGFIPLLHAAPREDRYSPLLVHIVINGWDESSRAEPWTEWMASPPPSVPKIYCSREICRGLLQTFPERRNQTQRRNRKPVDGSSLALFLPHLRDPLILSSRSMRTLNADSVVRYAYGEIYCRPKTCIREIYICISAHCICTIMMNNIIAGHEYSNLKNVDYSRVTL